MFKYLLIVLLISQVCFTQRSQNPVDICLNKVYDTTDKVLEAAQQGVTSNWLDMAKNILEAGADGIEDYEACTSIRGSDCTQWVNETWTKEQQKCFGLFKDFVAKCKRAHDDTGKAWAVLSKDLFDVFQSVRAWRECMPA